MSDIPESFTWLNIGVSPEDAEPPSQQFLPLTHRSNEIMERARQRRMNRAAYQHSCNNMCFDCPLRSRC